jgi:hypothetical protein
MKNLIIILILFTLISSCIGKRIQEKKQVSNVQNYDTTDSISPKVYGQLILDGKIIPSDNLATNACLEELFTEDQTDKEFFFKVYRKISANADGALSEMIGGITKSFFELNPDFCLEKFKSFEPKEKDSFIENIAYEFYASGIDYENDINEYIEKAEKKLENKNHSNLESLIEIKKQLIYKSKKMNEE